MLKKIKKLENKHAGSTTAIIFGIFFFASGARAIQETGSDAGGSAIIGISLLFGAIAYRMAKKRKLGVVKLKLIRIPIEVICISISTLSVVMAGQEFIITRPISAIVAGAVLIAYIGIVTYKNSNE